MILSLSYIGLSLLMFLILVFIGFEAINKSFTDKSVARKKKRLLLISLSLWQLYIFSIAATGILQNYDFPPRFAIFLILPAFLFTGIFIYNNRNKTWIDHIPKHWLIFYQSFRILIETLFVFTVAKGLLHPNVTIEGYNYDMIYAFTAPLIGYLFLRKKISDKVIIWWNFIGLAVITSIIFLFITTIYFPKIYPHNIGPFPLEFVRYPYVLIAGFLMPSAVFIHVLSIVQLRKKSSLTD